MVTKHSSSKESLFDEADRPPFGVGCLPPRIKVGNREIELAKIKNKRIKKFQDYVTLVRKCHQISLANDTGTYLEKMKLVKDRIDSFKYLQMKNLEERKQRLRELLHNEETALTDEMNRLFPTADTRFHETWSKVTQYKMKKELARQEYVKEMYNKRYRRDHPDLNNKLIDYRRRQVTADRPHNVALRDQMIREIKEGERLMDEEYFRRGREDIAREEENMRQRAEKNRKIALENVEYMKVRKQRESDESRVKLEDEKKLLEEIAVEIKQQQEKEFAEKIEKMRVAKEIKRMARDLSNLNKSKLSAPKLAFDEIQKADFQDAADRAGKETLEKRSQAVNDTLQFLNYDRDLKAQETAKEKSFSHRLNQEAHNKMLAELNREKDKFLKWKAAERDNQAFILQEIQRKADDRAKERADKLTWKTSLELPSEKIVPTGPDFQFRSDILSQIKFNEEMKQEDLREKLREQSVMKKETEAYQQVYDSILKTSNVDRYDHPMRKRFREMFPGRL